MERCDTASFKDEGKVPHYCSVVKLCPTLRLILQPRGLEHAGLPRPSLSPRVCSNSCPLSQWR